MKIGYTLHRIHPNQQIADLIESEIKTFGFELDNQNPDILFSVGGDGTFLRSIQDYLENVNNMIFIGINEGVLGFYCSYKKEDIHDIFVAIKDNNLHISEFPLLTAKVNDKQIYSLNEIRVESPLHLHTIKCDVFVNGELLENFHGNGLMVCSSTGSTAYNRSIGGSIINSEYSMLELSEIAPLHSNAYASLGSSFISSEDTKFVFKGRFDHAYIGYDSLALETETFNVLEIYYSDKRIKLAHPISETAIGRLRRSFIRQ